MGNKTVAFCSAELKEPLNASEAGFEFDYGFTINMSPVSVGTTVTNSAPISPTKVSFAGSYTCTVTVITFGVCGGGGSEPACPSKTSDPVQLMVKCKFI